MENRLIKFRAWDKLENRFIYPDKGYQGHFVLDLNGRFHNLQNGSGGDDYIVQQFTGFKDKNGKEIYEGDVCLYIPPSSFFMYSGQNDVEVFYETDRGQYMCKSKKGNFRWMLSHSFTTQSLMVIGNKSQNPELLK